MEDGNSGKVQSVDSVAPAALSSAIDFLQATDATDNETRHVTVQGILKNVDDGKSIVLCSYQSQEIRLVLPPTFSPFPHEGDHLLLSSASSPLYPSLKIVIDGTTLRYTRQRENVYVRLTDIHEANNGNRFVFFEKNACCDIEAMPEDTIPKVGTLYNVFLVESSQPKKRQWRAYGIERVLDEETVEFTNDVADGVTMTRMLDFGQVMFGEVATRTITIQNVNTSGLCTMDRVSVGGCPIKLISPAEISDIHFEGLTAERFYPSIDFHPFKSVRYSIPPMVSVQLTVRITGLTIGMFQCVVKVHFLGRVRKLCEVRVDIVGESSEDNQVVPDEMALASTKSSRGVRMRFERRREEAERLVSLVASARKDGIVPGPSRILNVEENRPERRRALLRNAYPIPEDLLSFLNNSDVTFESLLGKYPKLKQPVDKDNYDELFHMLLFLEEHQGALDVRQFDMISGEMKCEEDGQYKLKVHNLQEHRPSLVRGDLVSVRGLADLNGPRFHGRINSVEMDCIKFACDATFDEYHSKYSTWDFAFMLNKNTYKKLHEMVNFAKRNLSKRLLFPDVLHRESCADRIIANLTDSDEITFCDATLNHSQRSAVQMVVAGKCQPLAHILFGPPGTGKTVTVVEIILQIFLTFPKGRILVCAPSNAGVDLIGEKLMQSGRVPSTALRRLLGFSRNCDHVPQSLASSVQTGCEEVLNDECRIVLTTCLGAALLFQLVHDFTHIVMDEAGFCTEPEALMPLAAAAGRPDVQVVLAGDPNQLGPVVFSPFAKQLGLEKSLMCRLLELPAYSNWPSTRKESSSSPKNAVEYCPFLVSKLDVSYRAVATLLKVPSQLFYDDELQSSVSDLQNVYVERLGIPALSFWPVKSKEFRESRSPSIYNPGQVSAVTTLLKSLLAVGLCPEDIGIITPYRLQLSKIRDALKRDGFDQEDKLKMGTVDEFQGQEKKAIILSTVRARKWQEKEDGEAPIKNLLGFVACPKRINVALTRAKFVMMIIGDPHLLVVDKLWRSILRYCVAKELYQRDVYNDKEYPPPLSVLPRQHKSKCDQHQARKRLRGASSDDKVEQDQLPFGGSGSPLQRRQVPMVTDD